MTRPSRRWALTILGVRLAAVAAVTLILWTLVRVTSGVNAFPPNTLWATLGLLPVNVLCFLLAQRWLRTEGKTVAAALGFDRRRLDRNVLWGGAALACRPQHPVHARDHRECVSVVRE